MLHLSHDKFFERINWLHDTECLETRDFSILQSINLVEKFIVTINVISSLKINITKVIILYLS